MKILVLAALFALSACTAVPAPEPAQDVAVPVAKEDPAWLAGKLTFRKVQGEAETSKPATGFPELRKHTEAEIQAAKATRQSADAKTRKQALDSFDCTAPDPLAGHDDAALPLVTCDRGKYRYDLAPVFLDGAQIATASAMPNPNGTDYVVMIEFDFAGGMTWGQFTTDNVGTSVAILVNGRVLSAPQIQAPILGGATEISGQFTKDEAERLAQQLGGR